ncbi:hypothetical protein GCM10011505_19140 [Tistrella bauzanensis]|uniref:Uncharacterized protein n=1 Tax=Tistrella bauzanensis TaxID=657419 RepID=A0ABQ1IEQ1_9PROT|nr:hypothetical protein [Tistrella bauzanensis]GGB37820.1 hypothetical protein GCM10011505_19140 [Tistrella bauzanensis]
MIIDIRTAFRARMPSRPDLTARVSVSVSVSIARICRPVSAEAGTGAPVLRRQSLTGTA